MHKFNKNVFMWIIWTTENEYFCKTAVWEQKEANQAVGMMMMMMMIVISATTKTMNDLRFPFSCPRYKFQPWTHICWPIICCPVPTARLFQCLWYTPSSIHIRAN